MVKPAFSNVWRFFLLRTPLSQGMLSFNDMELWSLLSEFLHCSIALLPSLENPSLNYWMKKQVGDLLWGQSSLRFQLGVLAGTMELQAPACELLNVLFFLSTAHSSFSSDGSWSTQASEFAFSSEGYFSKTRIGRNCNHPHFLFTKYIQTIM